VDFESLRLSFLGFAASPQGKKENKNNKMVGGAACSLLRLSVASFRYAWLNASVLACKNGE